MDTVKMNLSPSSDFHWSPLNCPENYPHNQGEGKSTRELGTASLINDALLILIIWNDYLHHFLTL